MRFWHQLVELLRFQDHQICGEANVWHALFRIFGPPRHSCMLTSMRSTIMRPRGGREACMDDCNWAPRGAIQGVCRVKSRGSVYRL